jgi:hypothetical protein
MFTSLDGFSKIHQHSIATIGAFGTMLAAFATVAAVIVSLRLARRSESVRLKAVLTIGFSNSIPSAQYAILRITNVGVRAAWLPILFFEWRIPFRKKQQPETMANWVNVMYAADPQREIKVGPATIISVAEMNQFRQNMLEEINKIRASLKWCKRIRLKRLRAIIYIDDDSHFSVQFGRAIRCEINSVVDRIPMKRAESLRQ